MPPRTVTLAIVAFWLATAGWFVARDVWPHIRRGEPPPYTIELADEALRHYVPVRWEFRRNGTKLGVIITTLGYREEDDTFELHADCREMTLANVGPIEIVARNYSDLVRVTREGELRAMQTDVTLAVTGLGPEVTGDAHIAAEQRRGRLERRVRLEAPLMGKFEPDLEPGEPVRGSVLNPTHPVNTITGLRPGQRWRQPLTDPRTEIVRAALAQWLGGQAPLPDAAPTVLEAWVNPEVQTLEWETVNHPCLVIEYRGEVQGEEFRARTWVRQPDGAVLRQEAETHGEKLVLQRE